MLRTVLVVLLEPRIEIVLPIDLLAERHAVELVASCRNRRASRTRKFGKGLCRGVEQIAKALHGDAVFQRAAHVLAESGHADKQGTSEYLVPCVPECPDHFRLSHQVVVTLGLVIHPCRLCEGAQ